MAINQTFVDFVTPIPSDWLNNVNNWTNNTVRSSIANLRLVSKLLSSQVFVTGYYAAHDGGGGLYTLDTTDVTSTDNGGTIIVGSDGGRWKLSYALSLNVKQFGAKGGFNDDTAVINTADTVVTGLGLKLYFPGDTYGVNNTGVIRNGCPWFGDGGGQSIIKALAQTWTTGVPNVVSITSKSNFFTKDMGFDVSAATFPAGVGNPGNIYSVHALTTCNQWKEERCTYTGLQAQVIATAVNGGSHWQIDKNIYIMSVPSGSFNQSINVSTSAGAVLDYRITNCYMNGSALDTAGSGGFIENNYIVGWKFGGGITMAGGPGGTSIRNVIRGNYCSSGASSADINATFPSGIEDWNAYDVIEGNICTTNSGHGIVVGNVNVIVNGNICMNNGQSSLGNGIIIFAQSPNIAQNLIITNNNCFDNQGTKTQAYGIYEDFISGTILTRITYRGNNLNGNLTGPLFSTSNTSTGYQDWMGPRVHSGGTASTPGTITNGNIFNQVVSINGAAFGDVVFVSFNQDLKGCSLTGYVNAAGTVTVVFTNNTGSSQTLTAGTLNIWVEKPAGYASL